MKKFLLLTGLIISTLNFAQTTNWCGSDTQLQNQLNANPELELQMDEHIRRITSGHVTAGDREGDLIIPVVVHIMHDNGEGNISEAQINSAITMLNADFNRENTDSSVTRNSINAPFAPVASDMEIRFELAKIDPEGNCTNGINRQFVGINSYYVNNDQKHAENGGVDAWDTESYFNIWVANTLDPTGFGVAVLYGYAEFPYSGGSDNFGVVIRHDYFGSVGTASAGERTITHELGHCFGLFHTFQGGCHTGDCTTEGDYCCDTPPVTSPQYSCASTRNTCTSIPLGDPYIIDTYDQYENYMSYAACQNMFSEDQKALVLGNIASIPFLTNLTSLENNTATGVGLTDVLCAADFYTPRTVICEGDVIDFTDWSHNGVTEWNWTFEGGTPATSTTENPSISYDSPGLYEVTLTAGNGTDITSVTKTNYIMVLSTAAATLPYIENFEALITVPDQERFFAKETVESIPTWELTDETGFESSNSVFIENYDVDSGQVHELISSAINLSELSSSEDLIFSFRFAYNKRFESNDEMIRFYISKDCGATWLLRKSIFGDNLSDYANPSYYTPSGDDDWNLVEVTTINSSFFVADFRYKFEFTNNNGNNVYIDDINFYTESMINTNDFELTPLTVYPNPANNNLTLSLSNAEFENGTIQIVNQLGAVVKTVPVNDMQAASNLSIDISDLAQGTYFLQYVTSTTSSTVKFIKV